MNESARASAFVAAQARVDALAVERVAQFMRKAAHKKGQGKPDFFHGVLSGKVLAAVNRFNRR
jgi:phenylalanine-4-hydroxylase